MPNRKKTGYKRKKPVRKQTGIGIYLISLLALTGAVYWLSKPGEIVKSAASKEKRDTIPENIAVKEKPKPETQEKAIPSNKDLSPET